MASLKSNNEFDSLEAFFNRSLKDASTNPSDGRWMQIEEELNKMEKEKRKRRFLWFFASGLLLVCGLATAWYFMPNEISNEKNTISSKNENAIANPTESKVAELPKENTPTNETQTKTTNEKIAETNSLPKQANYKIQLGAFKHRANVTAFNAIPYKVISVNDEDGYTKYYAEANEPNALEKIQQAGFSGAFVKNNFDESKENLIVKNEGVVKTNTPNATAIAFASHENNSYSAPTPNTKTHISVTDINPSTNNNADVAKNETKIEAKNSIQTKSESAVEKKPVVFNETKTPVTSPVKTEETKTPDVPETKTPVIENTNSVAVTKTDSVTTPLAETKPESTPAKEEKKDSLVTPAVAAKDSSKKLPFIPEFALLFTGGPTIFSSAPQSSNPNSTLHEAQPNSYNGEVTAQYRPFKYFSFSGGVNYSTFTAKQDVTYFRFSKWQQEDYQFHSSFGSMAVAMTTMLEGFYFAFPGDTFFAKYSYSSTLQTVNIPLQANLHFLNSKWISLYLGLGSNNSFVIGQQSHLTLLKENKNTDFTYHNVTANRFNASLMMSLGCDIRITKHWFITLLPSYKYGLTNISPVSGTNYKPSYFSGNAGVKFKF